MEIWRDTPDFEGYYQASSEGRFRSLDRVVEAPCRWGGTRKMRFKGKILKQTKNGSGYLKVSLSKNSISFEKDSHVLIYETFYGKIPKGMQVNHIDENKTNNVLTNLNLMTPKENSNWGTGIERMRKSKSKEVFQCDSNNKLIAVYESTKIAGKENGFDQSSIAAAARGEYCNKGHSYKDYNWYYTEDYKKILGEQTS